jgi:hypothetical protein
LISVLKGWGTVLLLIDLLTSFRYLELRALIDDSAECALPLDRHR